MRDAFIAFCETCGLRYICTGYWHLKCGTCLRAKYGDEDSD